jgi:probable H4MPT-linked C1 transfer pathway protein
MSVIAGYDIGGAHLKVARIDSGRITAVRQIACPLWQGLDRLDAAFEDASEITAGADTHAIAMTAELTEIFESRHAGVLALLTQARQRLGENVKVFMGLKGFGDVAAAAKDTHSVASANFLATAKLIAGQQPATLLIDMGSTTTDIIACDRPQGLSDAERLQTGELVYTGLTRTPVAAVTAKAPLLGQWQTLARDNFATMADVRRVLGILADDVDMHATNDDRGTSVPESLTRLSRGFGRDGEERHLPVWKISAAYIREVQLRSIVDGALQLLSRPGLNVTNIIAAGIGASEVEAIASRIGLPCMTFGKLINAPADFELWATRCAPAVAVALLQTS